MVRARLRVGNLRRGDGELVAAAYVTVADEVGGEEPQSPVRKARVLVDSPVRKRTKLRRRMALAYEAEDA